MIRNFIISAVLCISFVLSSQGKDYKASLFGIKSDGITLNTGSIQTAVNFISENGGGRLVFYVGRYLTGSIELKSNVTIHLEEGAVLVGVPSIYDYYTDGEFRSLLFSDNQKNISVTGKGVIMGNGRKLIKSRAEQIENGHIQNGATLEMPGLVQFMNCDSVVLSGIILMNSGGDVVHIGQSGHVNVDGITIKNGGLPVPGLILAGNNQISVLNSYLETGGDEMIFIGTNDNIQIVVTKNEAGEQLQKP